MTPVTLTQAEVHYLRQADAAPDGLLQEHGAFGMVPLRHLIELGYLSFEGAGGSVYRRTYRLTDAGRAALKDTPAPDVPLVEQPAAPVDDLRNGKVGELNEALARADKWRQGQSWETPLMGYRFRWDGDYGGWKLASPKPGAPVYQSRRFMSWLDYLQDYQVNGIEALKALQAPSGGKGMTRSSTDAQAPLWPASEEPPQASAEIRVSTPDQAGAKPVDVADRRTPKRTIQEVTHKPGTGDSSGRKRSAPAVTDSAAPAKTAVAESPTSLASKAAPEKPAAAPKSGRWTNAEIAALSSALIKFAHSIGENVIWPGALNVHLSHEKHYSAAVEAVRAVLPPDADVAHTGPKSFCLIKRTTPAAPPSAPTATADVAGDKREQRPVTLNHEPRSTAFDDSQPSQSSVTHKVITPAARHPRPRWPGDPVQATCAQCGKTFTAQRSDAKTCSPTCRKAYSRRAAELRKAYEEATRALAEIGYRMRKYPDLVESATGDLETLARQAARLLVECQDVAAAK